MKNARVDELRIQEDRISSNISLGMFRPEKVEFIARPCRIKDQDSRGLSYTQLDFYRPQKKPIEKIPFEFRYAFHCAGRQDCPGHDLLIIDWELNQSFRKWRYKYKVEDILLEKTKRKWLNTMCSPDNETHFFVGNAKIFPNTFMVLGVFYPPKT